MDKRDRILTQISQYLDISPSDFKVAQERFNAVKNWLTDGIYKSGSSPDVYLQGSFRLGTVVRPYVGDKDGAFDIDQVCEISVPNHSGRLPSVLKNDVGDRLKENADYLRMLDEEGKRCWTLEYASENNRPGFHIDILPALPTQNGARFQIDITDKIEAAYSWSISNPKGYYYWFKSKNVLSDEFISVQRQQIFVANSGLYSEVNDVPKQLVRSSLQRAIQIMKRHRDVHFAGKDHKPISIIITTIAASVYSKNSISGIISEFTQYVANRRESLIRDGWLEADGVLDFEEGEWLVPNPADQISGVKDVENFADKWSAEEKLSTAFFEWAEQLQRDLFAFSKSYVSDDLNLRVKTFNKGESCGSILQREVKEEIDNKTLCSENFLRLIHLAIEGKMAWKSVESIARSQYNNSEGDYSKNVAKINYYQVARHQGVPLAEDAINDIKQILEKNSNSPAFVMCCNLLLGTVTKQMINRCVADHGYSNVLQWPIMKLAKQSRFLNMEAA